MDDTIAICLTIIMIHTTQYNEIIHYSLHFSRLVTKSYPVSLGFFDSIKLHNNCMYKSYVPWLISQIYT